jgi:hypothetical protein
MSEIKVNKLSSRTGNAVTLGTSGDTFTIPAGVTLTNSGTATGFGSDSDISWQAVVTSDTTMVAGRGYFVDSSGGTKTMTLPASPTIGDMVSIIALDGATNTVTIARNSSNIEGGTSNLELDQNYGAVELVFTDASNGWVRNSRVGEDKYISATGGTETSSGDFKIHTFNSSSNFVVSQVGTAGGGGSAVSYMVVAGGGGGGGNRGGGGGAGGFREGRASNDSYTVSPLNAPAGITVTQTTYPITVGAAGSGEPGPTANGAGTKGSNSVFSTITSAGGGGGRDDDSPDTPSKSPGGSGGGGGGGAAPQNTGGVGNTPPVSPPQGNTGGSGTANDSAGNQGGGGGGATEVGVSNSQPISHAGAGATTHISGSPVAYAGGGGAGAVPGKAAGNAGTGGGSAGASLGSPAPNAANNKGGGGGGGSPGNDGGNGGSGVVIIRYKYQ